MAGRRPSPLQGEAPQTSSHSQTHHDSSTLPNETTVLTPTASRSSIDSQRSPPSRNPSLRLASIPSAASRDRQSLNENLRGIPPSPRATRQPSLGQAAVQELIDNPPTRNPVDPQFQGRDWQSISISELVNVDDVRFVEADTGIEAATEVKPSPHQVV